MITLVLQSVCTLLLAKFAMLALGVARRLRPGNSDSYAAWMVVGVVFSVYTADKAVQEVFGIWAFFAGEGSWIFPRYLRLATVADHSRTLLMFALYASLVAVPFRAALGRWARWLFLLAIASALAAGGLLGWEEGAFQASHLMRTAEIDVLGFVALGSTLLFLMLKTDVDRLLWASIATYGFTSVLGVLFLSTLSWIGIADWTPAPWSVQAMRCTFAAVMIAFARRRDEAARMERRVPPMMEPLRTPVRTM